MARRKEKDIRKISKSTSGSYYLTLPINVIEALRWRKGQKVRVKKYGKKIIIEDWKPPKKK